MAMMQTLRSKIKTDFNQESSVEPVQASPRRRSPRRSPRIEPSRSPRIEPRRSPRIAKIKASPRRRSPRIEASPRRRSPRHLPQRDLRRSPRLLTPKTEGEPAGKSLTRSRSFEQCFRGGNRRKKSQKQRMLRKLLASRLTPLEPALLAGEFHDDASRFKNDEFFERVSPIVYSITGKPEDCSDDEFPGQCMVMAKDIMKKKKQYADKRQPSNGKSSNGNGKGKGKSGNVKSKSGNGKGKGKSSNGNGKGKSSNGRNSRKRKLALSPNNCAADDVDDFFRVSDDDECAFNCCDCNVSLMLSECFPEVEREKKSPTKLYCHKCFRKTQALLDRIDLSNSDDISSKRDALPPKPKRKKTNTTASKTPSRPKKFKVGDYVLAKFPGYGDEFFKAEIYSKYQSKYHLYFLEDGSSLKNQVEDKLVAISGDEEWTKRKRADFLQMPFLREGKKWHAVEVGKRHRMNKYGTTLVRSNNKKDEKVVWLDVSVVQKLIKQQSSS